MPLFLVLLAILLNADRFCFMPERLGSFRAIFVCGGHSPAKTPVADVFSVLAPCARTRRGTWQVKFIALRGRAARAFLSLIRMCGQGACARTLGLSARGCRK